MTDPTNWLYGWLLVGGFVGSFIQPIYAWAQIDAFSFAVAFWFARTFYENYCDQLNCAGLIIGTAFISIFVLPGSIFILVVTASIKLMNNLWNLFKYVFRRKDGEVE